MRDVSTLIDICQAIELISNYIDNISYQELLNNQEKQDAILRRIMIIGEATKRLSLEFRKQHPSIPWRQIAGMRDIITHEYDNVDLEEVWTVITVNLPTLYEYIYPLLPLDES
ncbi:MAG: DUF86 domain-containing protein [Cyanobacterium sp. T60_A2020_053]|nr:DUF86 domain-containing protein [Cyanobacterium sp. T60_A2020_053]